MSFIPSFILSALIFCNMTVPGGWNEAAFTEGIICEIPDVRFTLSLDESADQATAGQEQLLPSLRNAAVLWQPERISAFKAGAGSLAVAGMNGSDTLSATLPARQDAAKPLALFLSWKGLSCLLTDGRVTAQFRSDLPSRLTTGWTRLDETNESTWFLRYPWHQAGNLFWLNGALTARFPLSTASLEATGTAALALTDILPPAASGALTLLLKAKASETTLAFSAAPARFLTPAGTFTSDTLSASASFTYSPPAPESAPENKAAWAFKAGAAFAQRQPAGPRELSKRLFSADLAFTLDEGSFSMGASLSAAGLCFEKACRDGELTAALDLALSDTSLAVKTTFLPFSDQDEDSDTGPAWSVKAGLPFTDGSLSVTADLSGGVLEKLTISLAQEKASVTLSSAAVINGTSLVWTLSYSKKW